MSVIALTYNYGVPILLGDVLISSGVANENIAFPFLKQGIHNVLPINQKYFPHSFKQKIYLINSNVAIAFAGVVDEIIQFLGIIKKYFSDREGTEEHCESFYESDFWRSDFKESSFIMLYQHEKDFKVFHHGCREVPSSRFELIVISGSGTEQFLEMALSMGSIYISEDQDDQQIAHGGNLQLISKLLTNEHHGLDTLIDYFGAAYETVFWFANGLNKYGDYAYIHGVFELDKNNQIELMYPGMVYKFGYVEELMVIGVFDFRDNSIQLLYAAALDHDRQDKVEVSFDFEVHTVLVSFHWRFFSGRQEFTNHVDNSSRANITNTVKQLEGSNQEVYVQIEWDPDFFEEKRNWMLESLL